MFPIQSTAGLVADPLGTLLVAVVVLALVVLIGRFVLNVAWRLVRIVAVVIGLLWGFSVLAPEVLPHLGM